MAHPDRRSVQVQIPSLAKAIKEEEARQLADYKPQTVLGPEDSGSSAHKIGDNPNAHITDKIYLFPESYNALRREISDHWPSLWMLVGWTMAHQAEDFVAVMNDALGMKIQFDGNKVDVTCATYLNELRRLRGLSGFALPTGA
jgi:hypothetical protein